jgi:hypothetical protein
MRITILTLTFAIGLLGTAAAQEGASYNFGAPAHSSTVEEGAARGFADVVRSRGMARLQTAEAMTKVEDARRAYIENRLAATQAYFDLRRMNAEYRDAARGQPLSFDQYVRLARQQAPERLSVSQLDPFTGMINWPAVLLDERYKPERLLIEELYAERANEIAGNKREIQLACENLMELLKADIDRYAQTDYLQARKFLESLKYEVLLASR